MPFENYDGFSLEAVPFSVFYDHHPIFQKACVTLFVCDLNRFLLVPHKLFSASCGRRRGKFINSKKKKKKITFNLFLN